MSLPHLNSESISGIQFFQTVFLEEDTFLKGKFGNTEFWALILVLNYPPICRKVLLHLKHIWL